jgi:signal transduction histidine kinase
MRLGIKGKQVAAVTSIVGLVVVVLSVLQLGALARVSLEESRERGSLLISMIFDRARQVVPQARTNPYDALRDDPGLRSILLGSNYSKGLTYAAIVDMRGFAIAHSDPTQVGKEVPRPAGELDELLRRNGIGIYREIESSGGETLEVREKLLLAGREFGAIRIGVSTLLVRKELDAAITPAIATALVALGVAIIVAMFLAQLILRPIHVIRGALGRLGQGEFGVRLDMPQKDEFGELGSFFNTMSAQLSADRSVLAGEKAKLESIVDNLEDAVAIFSPEGEILFANPAMRVTLPAEPFARPVDDLLPADHPYRRIVEDTLASHESRGPVSARLPGERADTGERLILTHAITDAGDRLVGVMLIARNIDYLSRVQSTINYSRKLAALGRLSAGVAHEVKNPLNAIVIHLELLKQKLAALRPAGAPAAAGAGDTSPVAALLGHDGVAVRSPEGQAALEHVKIITSEIRRLDEVMQGFLKFTRPEDLHLQAIDVGEMVDEIVRVIRPEAEQAHVAVEVSCPDSVPDVSGDPAMLRQALLNLGINAIQAMPNGGSLRITCSAAHGRRVELKVEDTGVGIAPQDLEKIFNLYFTTKPSGSGIGLSMVYRTVQLHDGDIDVQSTPGRGTTFRLLLPQL